MDTAQTSTKERFPLETSHIPADAWRPCSIENGRTTARFAERELENIRTYFRRPLEKTWFPVRFQDYSLFGFGLLLDAVHIEAALKIGERIDLKIIPSIGKELTTTCKVENLTPESKGLRVGLRRFDHTPEGSIFADPPHLVPSDKDPIRATLEIPLLFRENCQVTLTGLSPKRALLFRSADSSLLILPGMEVVVEFGLPSSARNHFKGEVVWIKKMGREILFGLKALQINRVLSEALGEHFLTHELGTPAQIHALGFFFKVLQPNLRFAYIENDEEYGKVLELRRKAYIEAGKKSKDTRPKDMASEWDRESRILCAFSGQNVVACVALTFPTSDKTPLRSEIGFPDKKYPIRIADKENMIEAINLCTDSAYRNGDLLQGMFTHIARTFLLSDREYLVTVCTAQLFPLYKKIGFKDTGHTCDFLNIPHHLIYGHKSGALYSKGMSTLVWNHVYGDLVQDLVAKSMLNLERQELNRIRITRLWSPLAKIWVRKKVTRQFNAMMQDVPRMPV